MRYLIPFLLLLGAWTHGASISVAILSSQTGQGDGTDHAQLSVSTNTGSGTLYYSVSTSCGLTPTAAQVKAGTVTGNITNGNQAVSSSGTQTANPSGLSGVTAYCAYYTQNTTAGDAAVVATSSFSTGGTLTFNFSPTAAWNAAQGGTFNAVATSVANVLTACLSPAIDVTVNVKLDYLSCGAGCLGQTFAANFNTSYVTNIRPKLVALPTKNTVQQAIFANPPANDPTGVGDSYTLYCAQAKAIGRTCITNPDFETDLNSTKSYDTTTGGNCPSGNCAQSILLHEFTEGLGRNWAIDNTGQAGLMVFTAYSAPGVRTTSGAGTHYPSIDAGTTNLISPFSYSTSSDLGDWTSAGTDAMTATYSTELSGAMSNLDIAEMTKQGWGLQRACRIAAGL